jgi:hypothetical protein
VVNGEALPAAAGPPGKPPLMTAAMAAALQRVAHAVVLGDDGARREAWAGGWV